MHAVHRPKFIIKIGGNFFPDLIYKQTTKFYFLKFEGKVHEMCFKSKREELKFSI